MVFLVWMGQVKLRAGECPVQKPEVSALYVFVYAIPFYASIKKLKVSYITKL